MATEPIHRARTLRRRLAVGALLLLGSVVSPCFAPPCSAQSRDSVAKETRGARVASQHDMHFAPPLDGPHFDVQSVDAQTLVVSRARTDAPGLEGFLIDVPSLIATLQQRVLVQRGLDDIAQLSIPSGHTRSETARGDASELTYPYQFSVPFSALTVELKLSALDDTREASWLVVLTGLFVLLMLAAIYALYRMVAVQVHFAERRANFVSAVSHELKTPLTAIRMYGELLRDGLVQNDDTRQEYYGLITAESERLSRLVENVLRLGQIEGRREPVARLPVRTLPSLGSAIELLRPRAEALGFSLSLTVEDALPQVQLDADGLTQVLFNCVDNALKYARSASDKRIELRCVRAPGGVRLCIRDFGPGVALDELARLCEPFYRAGSELTRGQQGVGLGLSLVKRIVEDMGGSVQCSNRQPGFEVEVFLRGE